MFRKLLVAVDLSDLDASRPSLDRAVEIASPAEGTLRLVHVQAIGGAAYADFAPPAFDVADGEGDADTTLAGLAASLPLPAERVSAIVRRGGVEREILAEADDMAADLIVIGGHDPSFASYVLGSHSGAVARDAACSVLVVRR